MLFPLGSNCCYGVYRQILPPRHNPKDKLQGIWARKMLQQHRSSPQFPCPSVFQCKKNNYQPALPACRSVTYKRRTLSLAVGTLVTSSFKKNIWFFKKLSENSLILFFKSHPCRFLVLFLQNHAAKSGRMRDEMFISFVK